jgi:hypothetical protein
MDQKAAYEMTITEKLELLTVPDMVDAIWARIETQLDIDMPPDDGPVNPPANPPAGTGSWTRVVITVFVAALVATIYFTNRKTNTNNNNQLISPVNTTTISSPGNTNDKPPPAGSPVIPLRQPVTQDKNSTLPLLPGKDSLITAGNGADISIPDSVAANPVLVPAPVISSVDTSKKKSRGVQGIKDADYRITPVKKDSSD